MLFFCHPIPKIITVLGSSFLDAHAQNLAAAFFGSLQADTGTQEHNADAGGVGHRTGELPRDFCPGGGHYTPMAPFGQAAMGGRLGAESPPKRHFYVFTVNDCCGDLRNVRGSDEAVVPGLWDPGGAWEISRGAPGPVNVCCGPRGALIFIENGRFWRG